MNLVLGIIVVGSICIFGALAMVAVNAHSKRDQLLGKLRVLPSFSLAEHVVAPDAGIGLDPISKQLAIAIRIGDELVCDVLPYFRLTGVDLLCSEGNSTITKKTGFATFTTGGNISAITLAITTTDERFGAVLVPLFAASGNSSVDNINRTRAFNVGNEWKVKLLGILRAPAAALVPLIGARAETLSPPRSASSVATELTALHRLVKDGALSEEEYSHAKAKLLSGG